MTKNVGRKSLVQVNQATSECVRLKFGGRQRAWMVGLFASVAACFLSGIGAQAAAPVLIYLAPSAAAAGTDAASTTPVQLFLNVGGSSMNLTVSFDGSPPLPLTLWGNFMANSNNFFTVSLPGSQIYNALPPGISIANVPITVWDVTQQQQLNPLLFTVVSSDVDPDHVQTALVAPGNSTAVQSLDPLTGVGISATLTNDLSGSSAAITVANYSSLPTPPGTIFEVGGGYYDLQITGASAGDTATVNFFYPGVITGPVEAALTLQFWDPTAAGGLGAFLDVLTSGGGSPVQNTGNGPVYNPFGGFFTVTFDNTSRPMITDLAGTIFTMAPAPLPATPATLWPANHKMVPVTVNANGCFIVSVTSNEPQMGPKPDWQITGPLRVNLRAERSGARDGRIYTILLQCSDGTENVAVVRVPHDKRQKSKSKSKGDSDTD